MFRKNVSGASVNNLAINYDTDGEQRNFLSLRDNLADVNNRNTDLLPASSASELLEKGNRSAEGACLNAFSSSLKVCDNATSVDSRQHSDVVFSSLMKSPVSKKSAFAQMTLAELLDASVLLTVPPTSKEFKVVLFNDSLKTCRFAFKQEVIMTIQSALLAARAPSHKYLASIAISIAQNTLAISDLKNKGILNRIQFDTLSSRLTKCALDCSEIGNAYYDRLKSKPDFDIWISFLVVKAYKDKKFIDLYKQSDKVDQVVKSVMKSRDEIKESITQNLDYIVNKFIYNYFQLQKQGATFGAEPLDLTKFIENNALRKIQALFASDSRNRPGHQFDAGGVEHIYDCYAEMFDHFVKIK